MAHAILMNAAEATLEADWAPAHPDVPIVGQNGAGEPPASGGAYLKIDYPVAREGDATIGSPGSNIWFEEGVFRIIVFSPRGIGTSDARAWASEIDLIFRGRNIADGVTCFGPVTDTDEGESDGNYFVVAVAVPYSAQIIG